jgi:hypothetical protein
MTHINVDFTEVSEQQPVPKGMYELQITGAEERETGENSKRPGSPILRFTLGFTELSLNAPLVNHYVSLPYDGDENASFKLLQMKRFLEAFNIPYDPSGIDTEKLCMEAVGCSGNVEVTLTEPNDNGDVFNRIILPRLRKEGNRPPR